MTTEADPTEYEGESGRTRSFFRIAMLGVKEGAGVEQTDEGFLVNGELFAPVDSEQ